VLLAVRADGGERTPLFSLTPIERTALAFARAGVRRFALTGDPDAVRAAETALQGGPCKSLRIRSTSHLAAAVGDESFFLARGDCHYDRQLVARFVAENATAVDSVVAVDFRAEAKPRGADLPLVAVWSREDARARVQRVAKGLVGADGVLVGLALATPAWALRQTLRAMPAPGRGRAPERLAGRPRGAARARAGLDVGRRRTVAVRAAQRDVRARPRCWPAPCASAMA
jgi:hypothetical protein